MDVLVAYGTGSGFTGELAEWIADELTRAGVTATAVDTKSSPDASAHDAVIVGSGIRAGNWIGDATAWVRAQADALRTRPVATFSCSLEVVDATEEKRHKVDGYTDKALEGLDIHPVAHHSFAGAYSPDRVGFAERMIMKVMKQNTPVDKRDENAVRVWTREILPSLG